jgi:hypothetical protein
MRSSILLALAASSLLAVAACSAGSSADSVLGGAGGTGGASKATGTGGSSPSGTTSQSTGFMTGSGGSGPGTCVSGATEDKDQDGYTVAQGDCNDCDPNVNPGAIEVIVTKPDPMTMMVPPPADEDCDGMIDNVPMPCDAGLALDSTDPMDGAKAIELCKKANGPKDWGVVSAAYVRADGTPAAPSLQYGILPNFGPNVATRKGASLLGISSGHARLPSEPGSCGSLSCYGYGAGTAPPGFPQNSGTCPIATNINDDVGLEVHLRAPTNANGYKFDFKFYSFEYPEWVCTDYNDQFMALVTPPPMGALNGNISFDSQHNPVSVNVAFFDVCAGCPAGAAELTGTGFDIWDDAGGTQWLQTLAPIKGGDQFSLRLAIWDTGDQAWDSTAVIDNFEWIATGGTVVVGTMPVN